MGFATANIKQKSPTFTIALGVFGVLGFFQIIAIGSAYTLRAGMVKEVIKYKESPVVLLRDVVEKEVEPAPEKNVTFSKSADDIANRFIPEGMGQIGAEEDTSGIISAGEVNIKPTAKRFDYVIKHPKVEQLLSRARDAYIMGDMGASVMLVEEARELDPGEAAVVDMLAQISEGMGAFGKAKDLYMHVFQMGVVAGPYYKRAASKLEKGVGRRFEDGAYLLLGGVNIIRSSNARDTKVVIPIRAREGEFIVGEQVEIQVHFYDLVNGDKIEPAAKNAEIISVWQNKQVDWNSKSVETLEVEYKIPLVDEVQQHLYGSRKYHGQVIELLYKGEVQDVVAHPRSLHYKHAKKASGSENSQGDTLPFEFLEDFNLNNPLLPTKPR